jgi:hypothetical protein
MTRARAEAIGHDEIVEPILWTVAALWLVVCFDGDRRKDGSVREHRAIVDANVTLADTWRRAGCLDYLLRELQVMADQLLAVDPLDELTRFGTTAVGDQKQHPGWRIDVLGIARRKWLFG